MPSLIQVQLCNDIRVRIILSQDEISSFKSRLQSSGKSRGNEQRWLRIAKSLFQIFRRTQAHLPEQPDTDAEARIVPRSKTRAFKLQCESDRDHGAFVFSNDNLPQDLQAGGLRSFPKARCSELGKSIFAGTRDEQPDFGLALARRNGNPPMRFENLFDAPPLLFHVRRNELDCRYFRLEVPRGAKLLVGNSLEHVFQCLGTGRFRRVRPLAAMLRALREACKVKTRWQSAAPGQSDRPRS